MAVNNVQQDIKLTKAEQEKERQAAAGEQLYYSYPLPENISELKDFAFGSLTWRDVIFLAACELIPVVLMLPFSVAIPQWLCVVIGLVIGLPFAFLSIKHVFTGDLPFEERLKISIAEFGESNLLNWDKTKKPDGSYVESSSQSFVPQVEFSADRFTLLPRNQGGFSVMELAVDDISQAKNTDLVGVVNSFKRMLDALIQDTDCTPIQIMLKSVPKNLSEYIESAGHHVNEIRMKNHPIAAARAEDYQALLERLDQEKAFYYRYYIVVTYREDAEHVGEDTMNTASVKRAKLKEKGMNPLNKRAKVAQQTDFDIGMTEEERKKKLRERQRSAEFGEKRTLDALSRRVSIVENMARDLGSSHTAVKPRSLTQHDIAKLIYECYNSDDKNIVDTILEQALDEKTTMYSADLYHDFPDLFSLKKKKKMSIAESAARAGALTTQEKAGMR